MTLQEPDPAAAPPGAAGPADEMDFSSVSVAVVLPTLNEEEGLTRTLRDLPHDRLARLLPHPEALRARLLVVDGGSTDGTVAIARAHGIPVLRQLGRGKGQAIRQALGWLRERGVRFAVVLDADFTYPGSMIPAMIHLLDAGSQLVVGVRQPVDTSRKDIREMVHRFGNGLLNLAASQLSGLPILDLCSGFWGVDVAATAPLALETDGFEIEAELFTKAYRAGQTVTQIPIPYRERVGVAKLRALRDGARILLTSIRFGRRQFGSTVRPTARGILREILSITLIHGEQNLVLVAHPSRRREAEGIAARLRNSSPQTRVLITSPGGTPGAEAPAPMGNDRAPPVVLTLPATSNLPGVPTAVVHLPRTSRLIALGEPSPPAAAPGTLSVGALARSAGYRLRMEPGGGARSTSVRAVFSNLFPSEERRELAFLGANGRHDPITVWEGGRLLIGIVPDADAGEPAPARLQSPPRFL